jgi:hypothetical protein
MAGGPAAAPRSLPERFFHEARRVLVKDSDRLDFDAADILRIAGDTLLQSEFREIFRNEVNNPQLSDIIVHYLNDLASNLESHAKISEIRADLLDRAGMTVAASVTVAAIGMIVASGGALLSVLLFAGGVLGLAATGTGRTLIKLSSHKSLFAADKVRRLASGLEMKK